MRNNPNPPTLRAKLAAFLTTIALALGLAVAGAPTPASAYTPTTETTCGQSASLGRRVCFDYSLQRIYVYTSDSSSNPGSYPAAQSVGSGSCRAFRSTAAEFYPSPDGVGSWAAPGRCTSSSGTPLDIVIKTTGSGTVNSIVVSAAASNTIRTYANNVNYEFVWVA